MHESTTPVRLEISRSLHRDRRVARSLSPWEIVGEGEAKAKPPFEKATGFPLSSSRARARTREIRYAIALSSRLPRDSARSRFIHREKPDVAWERSAGYSMAGFDGR